MLIYKIKDLAKGMKIKSEEMKKLSLNGNKKTNTRKEDDTMKKNIIKRIGESTILRKSFVITSFVLLILIVALCNSAEAATINLTSPIGGEVYVSGESMTIGWEVDLEGDAADSIILSYAWGGSSERHYIRSIFDSTEFFEGTYDWTVPTVSEMSYLRIIAQVAVDGSGTVASDTTNHVKIIPSSSIPSVFLSYPRPESSGSLILEGGSECVITWDVTGCASHSSNAMQIHYTLDGGFTYHGIVTLFPCDSPREYHWTVPEENTTRAKIRLRWGDLDQSTSVYNFTITTDGESNSPPTANAGADQEVVEGSTVILSGTGSSDPDGDSLTYEWEQIDSLVGYDVDLQDADTSTASFVAPDPGSEPKILTFRLTVTDPDGTGIVSNDTINVTVNPSGPQITSFTPDEGWFKKPITLHGSDLAGAGVYMHGTRVATAPYVSDTEFTFYLPDLEDLGPTNITVSNLAGSFTTAGTFNVLPVPYQWDWGFRFHNPDDFSLSWGDYDRCFGHSAVTWEAVCCEWDGIFCERACHDPFAQLLFDNYVRDLSQPGTCWGVSVASLKYFYGDLELDPGVEVRDLGYNYDHVVGISREIRKLHISQVSAEVIDHLLDHIDETPSEILARIEADLSANRPGVISIQNLFEGLDLFDMEGHAMVPVRLEQANPGEWRIYVYDSNRERFSTSRDNTNTDEYEEITDWNNYPYIRVFTADERWNFEMAGGALWEADTTHRITISSDLGETDIPFYGISYYPRNVSVRDNYTLPTSLSGLGMILFGSADSGIEDSEGNVLGYDQDGRLRFEIAGGVPICPMGDALFSEREFYVLPDGDYQVNIYGKGDGIYNWQSHNQDTMFAIQDTEVHEETQDTVTITRMIPSPSLTDTLGLEEGGSSLTFETSDSNKMFSVTINKMIAAQPVSGTNHRIFKVLDTTISQDDKAQFGVTNDSNSLVYVNNSDQVVNFDLYLSQVKLSPQPEPPDSEDMIPIEECSLLKEGIEIRPHTALRMTPSDWENLEEATVQYDVVNSPEPNPVADVNICTVEEIYGEHTEETELLRYFRDNVLSKSPEGQEMIKLYYHLSPVITMAMQNDEEFKEEVKGVIDEILPLIRGEVK